MTKRKKVDSFLQFAVLPWRISAHWTREILLLTSRETHSWVIPKGWPMKGRKPAEVASREAYEEAGLIGRVVGKRPLGSFHYEKRVANKKAVICHVRVYLFRVEHELDDWPGRGERQHRHRRSGRERFFQQLATPFARRSSASPRRSG